MSVCYLYTKQYIHRVWSLEGLEPGCSLCFTYKQWMNGFDWSRDLRLGFTSLLLTCLLPSYLSNNARTDSKDNNRDGMIF